MMNTVEPMEYKMMRRNLDDRKNIVAVVMAETVETLCFPFLASYKRIWFLC